jgi:hypothetical protein
MYTILIGMIKMFVMSNRMFILNGITKKVEAEGALAEIMNGLEAMEDELKEIGFMELVMLLLFVVMSALAFTLVTGMVVAAAQAAALAGMLSVPGAFTSISINTWNPLHGRSCTAVYGFL